MRRALTRARRDRMADEIRNGGFKVRVVRLLGHRDDAGAWQIRDFLKRSVVEFQWIELSTEEDCRRVYLFTILPNDAVPHGRASEAISRIVGLNLKGGAGNDRTSRLSQGRR